MAGPQLGLRSLERSAGAARLADATAAPEPHSVLARGPRLHTPAMRVLACKLGVA